MRAPTTRPFKVLAALLTNDEVREMAKYGTDAKVIEKELARRARIDAKAARINADIVSGRLPSNYWHLSVQDKDRAELCAQECDRRAAQGTKAMFPKR